MVLWLTCVHNGGFTICYKGMRTSVGRKHVHPPDQAQVIDAFIQALLSAGIIERASRGPFLWHPFLIPKLNGEPRLFIDYSHFTTFLRKLKVSQPLFSDYLRFIPIKCGLSAVRLDLKHAFYSVPILCKSRFITTFIFGSQVATLSIYSPTYGVIPIARVITVHVCVNVSVKTLFAVLRNSLDTLMTSCLLPLLTFCFNTSLQLFRLYVHGTSLFIIIIWTSAF